MTHETGDNYWKKYAGRAKEKLEMRIKVISAFLEGKRIEFKNPKDHWEEIEHPLWDPSIEYRVAQQIEFKMGNYVRHREDKKSILYKVTDVLCSLSSNQKLYHIVSVDPAFTQCIAKEEDLILV